MSTSPLLQCLENADRQMPEELTATPQAKGDVVAALQQRIRSLEEALASEAARKPTSNPASLSGTPYRTAAASLIQNGVPVIPASTVDLDLSRKPLLGRGVYSEVLPAPVLTFCKQMSPVAAAAAVAAVDTGPAGKHYDHAAHPSLRAAGAAGVPDHDGRRRQGAHGPLLAAAPAALPPRGRGPPASPGAARSRGTAAAAQRLSATPQQRLQTFRRSSTQRNQAARAG